MMDPVSIESRLQSVKVAVRKATEEALKSASKQESLHKSNNANNNNTSSSSLTTTTSSENVNPNLTSSESFSLGMTLFGQEQSVLERSIQEKLTKMEHDLSAAQKALLEEDGSSEESPEALQEEAMQLKKRLEFLQICSRARASLDQATTLSVPSTTNEPDYLAAADHLLAAKDELASAQALVKAEEQEGSGRSSTALFGAYRIIDSLQTAIRRKNLDILTKATSSLETSVTITKESMSVKGSLRPDDRGLYSAYNVMEKLSPTNDARLHKSMNALVTKFVALVVQPVLDNLRKGVHCNTVFSHSSTRVVTTLEWECEDSSCEEDEEDDDDDVNHRLEAWNEAFTYLQRTLGFFQQIVLLDRDSLSAHVGKRLFSVGNNSAAAMKALGVESNRLGVHSSCSILKPMLDLLWDTCIPPKLTVDKLDSLDSIAKRLGEMVGDFDTEMVRLKFYKDDEPTPLRKFVTNFSQSYVDKRRSAILQQARTILLQNDYHNTVEVGEDVVKQPTDDGKMEQDGMAVFHLHKASVSQTATMMLALCRTTMDEAVVSSTKMLPSTLYRTAREVLDLFRAIIPMTLEHEIAHVPRTAAILHNDCVYLAHHCLTLGLEYKEQFAATDERGHALRQTCMFVDMVPIFRELADQVLGDQLERQQRELQQNIVCIPLLGESLKSNESLSEWVDAETAMKAGIHHVSSHNLQWGSGVLSKSVYTRCMGFLMDSIFTLFLDQVFMASAISEPASHFVGSIFRLGMQGAVAVMGGADDLVGCQSWNRFSAVGRFTEMSLADITVALSEGVFRSITGPELSHLIQATFDDSPKRRVLLQALSGE